MNADEPSLARSFRVIVIAALSTEAGTESCRTSADEKFHEDPRMERPRTHREEVRLAVPKYSCPTQTFFVFLHFFVAHAHRPCILRKVHLLGSNAERAAL